MAEYVGIYSWNRFPVGLKILLLEYVGMYTSDDLR